jgi:DNA polymerase III delta subunit
LAIAGERGKLTQELKNLRESGEDANKFLGLLASQIFALAAAVFLNKNIETSRELKIHPFQLTKAGELANQIGTATTQKRAVKKLAKIFAETDAKMKLADSKTAWRLVEISLNRV